MALSTAPGVALLRAPLIVNSERVFDPYPTKYGSMLEILAVQDGRACRPCGMNDQCSFSRASGTLPYRPRPLQ
jgi:hypothetical protein